MHSDDDDQLANIMEVSEGESEVVFAEEQEYGNGDEDDFGGVADDDD